MFLFQRPHYLSDATQFLQQLEQKNSDLPAQQQAGRALLWDKDVDRELWQEYRAGRVPQKSYVYYSSSKPGRTTPV